MLVTESFHGFIETTQDVLLIFEGCRRGLLPRICRRLQERERKMIRSGSVFVFDQRESGIKRWTDGRVWSPSRILGNFLIYRELDKRNPGDKKMSISSSTSLGSLDERRLSYSLDSITSPTSPSGSSVDHNRERQLVGSLSDTYKFRQDGLIKKTMSIVVNGVTQHLISYYDPRDVRQHKLRTPSSVPELASLEISPELLVKQNFRIPPMVEPTFDHTDGLSNGPLSPPDSLSGSLDRRIHPLRSMSLGSVRQDINTPSHHVYSTSYQSQGQRMDGLKPDHHSPTISNFVQPALPVPTNVYNAFSAVQSPTSMSSSPSTPMLSPARASFQHQRHYSTSSASSSSLSSSVPRYDPRHYSADYSTSPTTTTSTSTASGGAANDRLQPLHPHHHHHQSNQMDLLSDNNNGNNNNYDQRESTTSQHHTANLGQLLNPVHPLQNDNTSQNGLMNSMSVSSHPHHSSFTDYNSGYHHNKDHPYHVDPQQQQQQQNNHQHSHHHNNNNDNNGSSGFMPIRYPMANQHHSASLDSLYDTSGGVHSSF